VEDKSGSNWTSIRSGVSSSLRRGGFFTIEWGSQVAWEGIGSTAAQMIKTFPQVLQLRWGGFRGGSGGGGGAGELLDRGTQGAS